MVFYKQGESIFSSAADALVVPVNTVGVMGAGLALAFKNRVPGLFDAYKRACDSGLLARGGYFVYSNPRFGDRKIICLATKDDWHDPSTLTRVENSLMQFTLDFHKHNIRSIAFPALGCGYGGLQWEEVGPLMERYLSGLNVPVEIYEPV